MVIYLVLKMIYQLLVSIIKIVYSFFMMNIIFMNKKNGAVRQFGKNQQ